MCLSVCAKCTPSHHHSGGRSIFPSCTEPAPLAQVVVQSFRRDRMGHNCWGKVSGRKRTSCQLLLHGEPAPLGPPLPDSVHSSSWVTNSLRLRNEATFPSHRPKKEKLPLSSALSPVKAKSCCPDARCSHSRLIPGKDQLLKEACRLLRAELDLQDGCAIL